MSLLKITIYKNQSLKEPFNEWLFLLDSTTRAVVIARIRRMGLGNFGDCKLIKGVKGIWELRIDYGPGYRVYFGKEGSTIVVLLVGGDKGTQKRDIEKAERYWMTYKESK